MLMLAITDPVNFQALATAKTADLPRGDAKLAWEHLAKLSKPKTTTTKRDLIKQYNALELGKPQMIQKSDFQKWIFCWLV